jgi:hypothetical protein
MKPEALGGLAGLGTRPGRTFTLQPENSEPTLTANDSLKVDHQFELIYEVSKSTDVPVSRSQTHGNEAPSR